MQYAVLPVLAHVATKFSAVSGLSAFSISAMVG
jgi:hypothetical protein